MLGARGSALSPDRRKLVGGCLSEEYAFEAAAIFNPSVIAHPDQSGMPAGVLRLLMSMRAVGEGHLSSIVFDTGRLTEDGAVVLDRPAAAPRAPRIELLLGRSAADPDLRLTFDPAAALSAVVIAPVTLPRRHGLEDLRLTPFREDVGSSTYHGT
jgi:hypothetical protein